MANVRLQDLTSMLFALTATNRAKKGKVALFIMLFMLVLTPQLAACAGIQPILPLKEANFSVRD